jgi:hypothetical protein
VVQRDRLEKDADAAVDRGRGSAGREHRGCVVRPGRGRDHDPRDVPEDADRIVVMEVAAKATLIAVAGDPDHHPVAVLTLREELQGRRLAAKLILRVVEVREVLDLWDGEKSAYRGA